MNTTNLLMRIEHHADISEPEYLKEKDCLVIKSPKFLKIEPRKDAYIDLKFNVELKHPKDYYGYLPQWWLKISAIFSSLGLYIENGEQ